MRKKGNGDSKSCPNLTQKTTSCSQKKSVFWMHSLPRIVLSLSLSLSFLGSSLVCFGDAYANNDLDLLQENEFEATAEPDRITITFDDDSTAVLSIGNDGIYNGYSYSQVTFPDSYPNMTIGKRQQFQADIDLDRIDEENFEIHKGWLQNIFTTSKNIKAVELYWENFVTGSGSSDDQYNIPQIPITGMSDSAVKKLREGYDLTGSLHFYNAFDKRFYERDFTITPNNSAGAELPTNVKGDAVMVANLKYISIFGYDDESAPIWISDMRVKLNFEDESDSPTTNQQFYGTWRFNDTLSGWYDPNSTTGGFMGDPVLGKKINSMSFTSANANSYANKRTYNAMYCSYNQTAHVYYLCYLDGTDPSTEGYWVYNTQVGWRDERLKEFTVNGIVEITPELYKWLTQNATFVPDQNSSFQLDVTYKYGGEDSINTVDEWLSKQDVAMDFENGSFTSWLGTTVGGIFGAPVFGTFTLGQVFGAIVALLIVLAMLKWFAS